jgi:hypothetical protein
VSPILVRPVREQLEHDRIIRQLQAKFRRKYEALINTGAEQINAVGTPPQLLFPDVVLFSLERGRKLQGIIEVETGESVNHLEALAEWAHFSKTRAPFFLYVPAGMVDVARRLCEDNHIYVTEIWSFHTIGDQVRFTMVHRSKEAPPAPPRKPAAVVKKPAPPPPPAKPVKKAAAPKAAAPKQAAPKASTPKKPAAKAPAKNGKAPAKKKKR